MTDGGRQWLADQARRRPREQIAVAVAMVEALDRQLAPIDKQLRSYARLARPPVWAASPPALGPRPAAKPAGGLRDRA
jgi:hypothetical protein